MGRNEVSISSAFISQQQQYDNNVLPAPLTITDLNNALGSNVPPHVINSLPALSNPLYSTCNMHMFSLSGHFTISSIVPRKNCDHPIYIDVYISPQKNVFLRQLQPQYHRHKKNNQKTRRHRNDQKIKKTSQQ